MTDRSPVNPKNIKEENGWLVSFWVRAEEKPLLWMRAVAQRDDDAL